MVILAHKKKTKQITVVNGCVIKQGKVLMALRSEVECAKAHLKWELPGGKVDFGESIEEALRREILEETGVLVKVKELLPISHTSYWDYEWGVQQTLCFYFVCEYISDSQSEPDHHIEEIAWQPLSKVKTLDMLSGTKEVVELVCQRVPAFS